MAGYVKYYRDPLRHPTRQYIGVTFNREDKLPYPPNAARRRRLGLIATTRKPEPKTPDVVGPSGIPLWVVRPGGPGQEAADLEVTESEGAEGAAEQSRSGRPVKQVKLTKKAAARKQTRERRALRLQHQMVRRETRVLHLQSDYSYREYNWEIGRLTGPAGRVVGAGKLGSRKGRLRARRRRREVHFKVLKTAAQAGKERRAAYLQEVAEQREIRARTEAAEAKKEAAKKGQEKQA